MRAETQKIRKNGVLGCLTFYGINLWNANDNIYVNGNRPIMGGDDRGFFRVTNRTFYIKDLFYELFITNTARKTLGVLFFHVKGMKKGRGLDNYDVKSFEDSPYVQGLIEYYCRKPRLISWEQFKERAEIAQSLPTPEDVVKISCGSKEYPDQKRDK
jgi:hypothetical protein